jgi:Pentapeptide repeats (8 copies)
LTHMVDVTTSRHPTQPLTPALSPMPVECAGRQVDWGLRDGGDVAEPTGVLKVHGLDLTGNGRPPGLRVIVRREASLRQTGLAHTWMRAARLDGAYVRDADFRWAYLREASLENTAMEKAKVDYADLDRPTFAR